jgi:S1-C subfamily serine protease
MGSRKLAFAFFSAAILCLAAGLWADKITLKDGTVLDGVAIKQGDKYWVKTGDGKTQMIDASRVVSVGRGGEAAPATGAHGTPATPAVTGGATFTATQRRAASVTSALIAVTIWQKFIDENPNDPDLPAAHKEMNRWQKMADDGSERINGKWVGGAEREALLAKASKLTQEGWELMHNNQTLQAIKKIEESIRLYPNSFRTNFAMGYLMVLADKNNEAIRFFESALRLQPKSPETLNNMGVAYMRQRQYLDAINCLYKAADYGDSKPLCQNLINGIASLPPIARNTPKIKPAMEAATLLASKYGINGPSGTLIIVGLSNRSQQPGGEPEGNFISSGTGFFINDQGLILTNRHVVKGAKTMLVMMNGKKQGSAEVVMIDEEQDLALVKLKVVKDKTPFVHLAKLDNPGDGAECTVMGFPLIDRLGGAIKITRGIVSSGSASEKGADIVTDAKVNPGNSGGPMLDKFGNVMGIVTMKSANSQFEDSYGMAISAGKIRKFLEKNKVISTPGDVTGAALNAEEIAARVKPAAVCIICTEHEREKE